MSYGDIGDLGEYGPSLGSYAGGGVVARTALSYVGGASMIPSVTARLKCIGRRALYVGLAGLGLAASSSSAKCLAQMLTAGVVPTGDASDLGALAFAAACCSALLDSSASNLASSALSCAVCRSFSADEELSSLFRRCLLNSDIHLSRSFSGMTRKRTHSLLLSSSGSISRMRSWLAAK